MVFVLYWIKASNISGFQVFLPVICNFFPDKAKKLQVTLICLLEHIYFCINFAVQVDNSQFGKFFEQTA